MALITLDRPDKRNAINDEMRTELTAAFAAFDADPSVRVVVLTGAGSAFCAGGDLSASATPDPQRPRIVEPLDQFSKPVIAAINGLAFGGGLELALACDLRIAAIGARFALPEVRIGSLPGSGGTQRLPAVVGPSLAAQMILTGEPIDAATALDWGLVNRVVPHDRVLTAALALAEVVAGNAPTAVRQTKRMLHRGGTASGSDWDDAWTGADPWAANLEAMSTVFAHPDAVEGPTAFAHKREPKWRDE